MINQIITSTVLIIAILLVSSVFEKRIHPCIKYAFWLLVAVKLLIPLPSFENAMSIMNAVNQVDVAGVQYQFVDNTKDTTVNGYISNGDAIDKENSGEYIATAESPVANMDTESKVTKNLNDTRMADIFIGIWICGMVVCGVVFLRSNLHHSKYLKKNRTYMRVYKKKLAVYEVEGIATPCLFGILAPAIYLQKGCELQDEEVGYILAHEYTHYRHGDHIWAVVRCICVIVYWFNPFVWLAARKSMEDGELACDAGTLRQIGESNHIQYGKTLIAVASDMSQRQSNLRILGCSTSATGGMREMKKRMTMLVKRPRTKIITLVGVVVLCCCMVGCTFGNAVEKENTNLSKNEEKAAAEQAEAMASQAQLEKAATQAEKVMESQAELEMVAAEQKELEESRKAAEEMQKAQKSGTYEIGGKGEDASYKEVTLYSAPVEDKVCIQVAPPGVRDHLNYYYIPDGAVQEKLTAVISNMTDVWPAEDKNWQDMKEAGYKICYNDKEYVALEGGYLLVTKDTEEAQLLVWMKETCDLIEGLLSDYLDYEPVDITQIKDIQSATLEVCGVLTNDQYYSQTITDKEVLEQFADWFRNAEYIRGGVDCCNEESCLSLTLASGEVIRLSVAMDSCSNFGINGVYYDYSPEETWDNTEFFSYFDEIPWEY